MGIKEGKERENGLYVHYVQVVRDGLGGGTLYVNYVR